MPVWHQQWDQRGQGYFRGESAPTQAHSPSSPPASLPRSLSLSVCPLTRTHRSDTHHAYLSGAILPSRAGFYRRIWLIPTQTLWKDIPTCWNHISASSFCFVVLFCSTVRAGRRGKGELELVCLAEKLWVQCVCVRLGLKLRDYWVNTKLMLCLSSVICWGKKSVGRTATKIKFKITLHLFHFTLHGFIIVVF